MKKLVFLISFVLISGLYLSAQNKSNIDSRLNTVYSMEYLNDLLETNPQELRFLNWSLDNSFTIMEMGPEKTEHLLPLQYFNPETKAICGTVESFDIENINIYLYSFERKYDKSVTFRIGSTGYAIIFLSEKTLAENFNKYQYGK
jgi:sporulation-control protein spo0M